MHTAVHRMSADEFADYSTKHGRCELVRGELRELTPAGGRHGIRTNKLNFFISQHVYEHDLGEVTTAETGFRLDDDNQPTVRAPDIAFVAADRAAAADTDGFIEVVPDLVVETLSPGDTATAIHEKTLWWLRHGVQLVWVVDLKNQLVTVHYPDGHSRRLRRSDTLTGDNVLPSFKLELEKLFP